MITDLERIGDHATDIAEILETGSIKVPVKDIDLAKMAEIAMDMIKPQCGVLCAEGSGDGARGDRAG